MLGKLRFDNEGKPICEICGRSFNKLGQHVYNSHGMSAKEYKIKFGLDLNKGLVAKSTKEKLQKANKDNYDKVVKNNLLKKGQYTRFKNGDKGRTKEKVSEQTRLALVDKIDYVRNFSGKNKG
ncbi:MAG: MucR family transcriptional regulator [Paraclostridium sp.]